MMGYGFGYGGWLVMLGCIVLIVAVIALVAWLATRGSPVTQPPVLPAPRPAGQDALELLRMRFARGEIGEDAYLAAKQVLEGER